MGSAFSATTPDDQQARGVAYSKIALVPKRCIVRGVNGEGGVQNGEVVRGTPSKAMRRPHHPFLALRTNPKIPRDKADLSRTRTRFSEDPPLTSPVHLLPGLPASVPRFLQLFDLAGNLLPQKAMRRDDEECFEARKMC